MCVFQLEIGERHDLKKCLLLLLPDRFPSAFIFLPFFFATHGMDKEDAMREIGVAERKIWILFVTFSN
jgi:hypothetical protein